MNTRESAANFSSGGHPTPLLEAVEINSGPNPAASVIWLHGLGADGHDFEPLVPHLGWPGAPDIRYVFPHAPVRPLTVNGGAPMRAWYDILSMDSDRGHDRTGIEQSVRQVVALIDREIERGITSDRIILAGFSQGGAIALQAALRYQHSLAGVIALSTYLLFADALKNAISPANQSVPIFLGHGNADPMVPFSMGKSARKQLVAFGLPVKWHVYPMPHAVCPEEIADINAWLRGRIG